jgi:hypothetical protein
MTALVHGQRGVFESDVAQRCHVQFALAHAGAMHIVFAPPCLEIRRYRFQFIDQFCNVWHARRAGEIAPEGRQHGGRLRRPIHKNLPHRRHDKQHPQQIAAAWRLIRKIEHAVCRGIPHHDVPTQVQDVGRARGQVVHQATHLRRHRAPGAAGFGRRALVSQQIQVAAFGGVQLQHARQVLQKTGRHADVAALFEPRIPSEAHAGQRGDFLAPQPRRAAAAASRQTQIGRAKTFAAQTQEFRQVRARAVQALGSGGCGHG